MPTRSRQLSFPAALGAALAALLFGLTACGESGTPPGEDPRDGAARDSTARTGAEGTGRTSDPATGRGPAGAGTGGASGAPVNVLFISLDTLRADHLQSYGHSRETSPNLARLADEGAVFEDCVATANWTLPTHTSLFTGLNPITHQVEEPTDKLPEGCPTLAEPFAAAGYRTAGFWSNPFLDSRFGYARGFERYERAASNDELRAMFEKKGEPRGSASRHRFPDASPREEQYFAEQTAEHVNARAMEWLAELEGDEPFFLFLHYNDIHSDYIAPQPYDRMFDPDYAGTLGSESYPHHPDVKADMPARELEHVRALYDGEIRWVDEILGKLFAALAARGSWENTLVVITADHGEGFFERGFKEHHYGLYRELLHIPLIVRQPGVIPAGTRVTNTVSQADVAPTILDLAGLSELDGADGRSLAELAMGNGASGGRPPVLSRTVLKPILTEPGDEMVALTTPEVHAVLRLRLDGREVLQVYDRRADPDELSPLPNGARTEAAGRALRAAAETLRDRRAMLPWVSGHASQELDPELYGRMKGWGYIK